VWSHMGHLRACTVNAEPAPTFDQSKKTKSRPAPGARGWRHFGDSGSVTSVKDALPGAQPHKC